MTTMSRLTIFALLLLFGAVSFLGGCNTVAGAGRDISNAGDSIEESAERNK
ncbi:entericidin A/B family lipoprotein [Parvibaculum sp.]|uniref:entericidin A/B family lipoprotein n=1 Tax=Parvibaculum sp. TaxID=2024848 RepID=UPI00391C916E